MATYMDNRGAHTIMDKIKLFERPATPSPSPKCAPRNNAPLKNLKTWCRDNKVKEESVNNTPLTLEVREEKRESPSPTPRVSIRRIPTKDLSISPTLLHGGDRNVGGNKTETFKLEVTALPRDRDLESSPRTKLTPYDKDPQSPPTKPLVTPDPQGSPRTKQLTSHDKDPQSSPRTKQITPQDPQCSPRTKQKEKVVRLEVESDSDEDDMINLHRLSVDERQLIRSLVRSTKHKNKMLDDLEESFRAERQSLIDQFEAEKTVWTNEVQQMQQELGEKNHELRSKQATSDELQRMLREAHDDLQEAQAMVMNCKRVLADHKKNTDIELYNKSQTLLHMDRKLGALTKLRESMECIICEERVAKIIFNPCHHLVLCSKCSHLVAHCPMCRSTIASRYEIYSNWVL